MVSSTLHSGMLLHAFFLSLVTQRSGLLEDYLTKLQRRRGEGSSVGLDGKKIDLRAALYITLGFFTKNYNDAAGCK